MYLLTYLLTDLLCLRTWQPRCPKCTTFCVQSNLITGCMHCHLVAHRCSICTHPPCVLCDALTLTCRPPHVLPWKVHFPMGIETPSTTRFLGTTWISLLEGISIGSAIFCTAHRQTCYICSNILCQCTMCMWRGLKTVCAKLGGSIG